MKMLQMLQYPNGEWPSSVSEEFVNANGSFMLTWQTALYRQSKYCTYYFLPFELAIPVGIASWAASYHCASDLP